MILADQSFSFQLTGFWDALFHKTWIDINILGLSPDPGLRINLISLLILGVVGMAAIVLTERLAGEKPGKNLLGAVIVALIGSFLATALFKQISFDIIIEGVPLISGLLGAIVFGVFYVLVRRMFRNDAK